MLSYRCSGPGSVTLSAQAVGTQGHTASSSVALTVSWPAITAVQLSSPSLLSPLSADWSAILGSSLPPTISSATLVSSPSVSDTLCRLAVSFAGVIDGNVVSTALATYLASAAVVEWRTWRAATPIGAVPTWSRVSACTNALGCALLPRLASPGNYTVGVAVVLPPTGAASPSVIAGLELRAATTVSVQMAVGMSLTVGAGGQASTEPRTSVVLATVGCPFTPQPLTVVTHSVLWGALTVTVDHTSAVLTAPPTCLLMADPAMAAASVQLVANNASDSSAGAHWRTTWTGALPPIPGVYTLSATLADTAGGVWRSSQRVEVPWPDIALVATGSEVPTEVPQGLQLPSYRWTAATCGNTSAPAVGAEAFNALLACATTVAWECVMQPTGSFVVLTAAGAGAAATWTVTNLTIPGNYTFVVTSWVWYDEPSARLSSSKSLTVAWTNVVVVPPTPPPAPNHVADIVGGVLGGICGLVLVFVVYRCCWPRYCEPRCCKRHGGKISPSPRPGRRTSNLVKVVPSMPPVDTRPLHGRSADVLSPSATEVLVPVPGPLPVSPANVSGPVPPASGSAARIPQDADAVAQVPAPAPAVPQPDAPIADPVAGAAEHGVADAAENHEVVDDADADAVVNVFDRSGATPSPQLLDAAPVVDDLETEEDTVVVVDPEPNVVSDPLARVVEPASTPARQPLSQINSEDVDELFNSFRVADGAATHDAVARPDRDTSATVHEWSRATPVSKLAPSGGGGSGGKSMWHGTATAHDALNIVAANTGIAPAPMTLVTHHHYTPPGTDDGKLDQARHASHVATSTAHADPVHLPTISPTSTAHGVGGGYSGASAAPLVHASDGRAISHNSAKVKASSSPSSSGAGAPTTATAASPSTTTPPHGHTPGVVTAAPGADPSAHGLLPTVPGAVYVSGSGMDTPLSKFMAARENNSPLSGGRSEGGSSAKSSARSPDSAAPLLTSRHATSPYSSPDGTTSPARDTRRTRSGLAGTGRSIVMSGTPAPQLGATPPVEAHSRASRRQSDSDSDF